MCAYVDLKHLTRMAKSKDLNNCVIQNRDNKPHATHTPSMVSASKLSFTSGNTTMQMTPQKKRALESDLIGENQK